jgi:hypothetical protein
VRRRLETRATIGPNRESPSENWVGQESLLDEDKGSFRSNDCGDDFVSACCCCESDIPDHALLRDDAVTAEADASADDSGEKAPGKCRAAPVVVVLLDDVTEAPIWAFQGYAFALEWRWVRSRRSESYQLCS